MISNILVLLAPAVSAAAIAVSASNCFNLVVPVYVESQSHPLLIPNLKNGYEATEFLLQATKRDGKWLLKISWKNSDQPKRPMYYIRVVFLDTASISDTNAANPDPSILLGKPINISTTFSISSTYCTPSKPSAKSSTLQVLTHGLGFDRSYWNWDGDLNYIAAATNAGYSTFSYDRLGTGASPIADPYNTVQTVIELAILTEITSLLRSGNISSRIPVPKKIVHIGHSYGSSLSNALAATRPELSDGIILTGYSLNATYQPWLLRATAYHLASENQPERFSTWSSGYLTWGDKFINQYAFFKYPYFDPKVLDKAEAGKFPFTLGEILTWGLLPVAAPKFANPVLIMAADSDLGFCGSDCHGVVDGPDAANLEVFSAAKPLETYIQPNTGHAMNLHFNATGWFGVVQDFLGKNGL